MYVVDLCLGILVSCMSIIVGLSFNDVIRSMRPGRLELICPVFHVIMCVFVMVVCGGCCCWECGICGVCVGLLLGVNPMMGRVHLAISCKSCLGMKGRFCSNWVWEILSTYVIFWLM